MGAWWYILCYCYDRSWALLSDIVLAIQNRLKHQESEVAITATTQFQLGIEDLNAGRYEMARKRFEYVIQIDPTFPNATEKLLKQCFNLAMIETPTVNC